VTLVDTSFWIALFVPRDSWHAEATRLWERGEAALSTNHVLGETWTFIRRRGGHGDAWRAIDAIRRSPRVTILEVGAELEREAWEWLRRHDERRYSFVDATSFAVMRRERIRSALAFDGDFAAAGFAELRP